MVLKDSLCFRGPCCMDHSLSAGIVFTTRRIVFTIRILVTGTEQYLLETAGHTHTYMHMYMYMYIYIYMYMYMYIYIYIYIYMYMWYTLYIYIYHVIWRVVLRWKGTVLKNDGIRWRAVRWVRWYGTVGTVRWVLWYGGCGGAVRSVWSVRWVYRGTMGTVRWVHTPYHRTKTPYPPYHIVSVICIPVLNHQKTCFSLRLTLDNIHIYMYILCILWIYSVLFLAHICWFIIHFCWDLIRFYLHHFKTNPKPRTFIYGEVGSGG